jgi:glycosyltransferase involved in cell wall biosynthesis
VLHFHDPELLPWGILAALAGRTVVYDVHEDVPSDIMDKDWIAPRLRLPVSRAAALLERAASAFLSAIVAATPAIARRFPSAKTVLVQNFPFLDEFAPMDGEPSVARDGFVYVGGITEIRGAREMVRAMSEIRRESSPRLVLAGVIDPPELLPELERLPGFDRCEFLGWRDRKSVAALMRRAIAGLVLFHPVQNHIEAQPNKLFEYMSAGLPVVASDFPVWRSIVVDGGCGICVDPLDPKAIAQALDYLRTHPEEAREMGRRGRRLVLDRYNWREEQGKLLGLYSRLC